jgi:hypothetical protein
MQIFNREFLRLAKPKIGMEQIVLYSAVTLSRVVKYAKTHRQARALLTITNNLLKQFLVGEELKHGFTGPVRW